MADIMLGINDKVHIVAELDDRIDVTGGVHPTPFLALRMVAEEFNDLILFKIIGFETQDPFNISTGQCLVD